MNYEKKYKEALTYVKNLIEHNVISKENAGKYFPELKESEDEMIRKDIIETIKIEAKEFPSSIIASKAELWLAWLEKQGNTNEIINRDEFAQGVLRGAAINLITWIDYNLAEGNMCLSNMECEDIEDALISGDWDKIYAYIKKKLEKQGEQKSNKIEPKFKVGDWIINNDKRIAFPTQILKIEEYGYITSCGYTSFDKVKIDYHLWTIQDAKDGDVLYHKSPLTDIEYIVMSRGINGYGNVDSYFRYNSEDGFNINVPSVFNIKSDDICPATKEQRDLLFQKMKEAGYEWDAEKKELKWFVDYEW